MWSARGSPGLSSQRPRGRRLASVTPYRLRTKPRCRRFLVDYIFLLPPVRFRVWRFEAGGCLVFWRVGRTFSSPPCRLSSVSAGSRHLRWWKWGGMSSAVLPVWLYVCLGDGGITNGCNEGSELGVWLNLAPVHTGLTFCGVCGGF